MDHSVGMDLMNTLDFSVCIRLARSRFSQRFARASFFIMEKYIYVFMYMCIPFFPIFKLDVYFIVVVSKVFSHPTPPTPKEVVSVCHKA